MSTVLTVLTVISLFSLVLPQEGKEWKVIQPHQEWEEGEVTSPRELSLIREADLAKALKGKGVAAPAGTTTRTRVLTPTRCAHGKNACQ